MRYTRYLIAATILVPLTIGGQTAQAQSHGPATESRPADGKVDLPTAQELIDLAPVFSLNDPRHRSFRIIGYARYAHVAWDVAYERPDRFSILVTDLADQTPYFFAVNQQVVLFDASHARVFAGHVDGPKFITRQDGDQFDFSFGIENLTTPRIEIDLKSVFSHTECTVVPVGAKTLKLTGLSKRGGTAVALIDRSKQCPYLHLELTAKGANQPLFGVETVEVDDSIPTAIWHFPTQEMLHQHGASTPNVRDWATAFEWTTASIAYRAAISNPTLRPDWEERGGKIDWEKARADDATFSVAARKLVSDVRDPKGGRNDR